MIADRLAVAQAFSGEMLQCEANTTQRWANANILLQKDFMHIARRYADPIGAPAARVVVQLFDKCMHGGFRRSRQ
jgi:hypothetical protein